MNMWKIDADKEDIVKSARELVYEQCLFLSDATSEKIIARVSEYEGEYINHPPINKYTKSFENMQIIEPEFDVQNVLGENASENDNTFVYELYITSKKTPKYKYRAFIMYYGIELYPVHIIMEEQIAEELKLNTEIAVTSESEFKEVLSGILGCKRISSVVEKLLSLNN